MAAQPRPLKENRAHGESQQNSLDAEQLLGGSSF